MIFPRSNIFIVYSSASSHYMELVQRVIREESKHLAVQEISIIKSNISDHGAIPLFSLLKEKMSRANGIIILYTPDLQFENILMPRPNVIFEMGMAFELLAPENILILKFPKAGLFSDIYGLTLKEIEQGEVDDIQHQIETYVKKFLGYYGKFIMNPLAVDKYNPEYYNLNHRYHQDDLGRVFLTQLDDLSEIENKIVYIAERLLFTGIMRSVHLEMNQKICAYLQDYRLNNDRLYKNSLLVLLRVFDYLSLRQEQRQIGKKNDGIFLEKYRRLHIQWQDLINWLQEPDIGPVNPLIPMLCYDYAGLTLHKIIQFKMSEPRFKKEIKDHIDQAKVFYSNALNYVDRVDFGEEQFWSGYVKYDFARLYYIEYLYYKEYKSVKKMTEAKNLCKRYFDQVNIIRHSWYNNLKYLPGLIRLQLECEYFYAMTDYIEIIKEFEPDSHFVNIEGCLDEHSKWVFANNDNLNDLMNNIAERFNKIRESGGRFF